MLYEVITIELAKKYNGEIISADSMQIYKGMDIATAKPTIDEMQGIPHHLISFLDSDKSFSVADYRITSYNVCYTKLLRLYKDYRLCQK